MTQQAESEALVSIGDGIAKLASEFWWLVFLVILAWYLRWYGKAEESDVEYPAIRGVMLLLEDMARSSRTAVGVVVLIVVGIAGFGGWIFNILPALVTGIVGGDPITIAVAATMGFVSSAALDLGLATPLKAIAFFFLVALAVWVARSAYSSLDG